MNINHRTRPPAEFKLLTTESKPTQPSFVPLRQGSLSYNSHDKTPSHDSQSPQLLSLSKTANRNQTGFPLEIYECFGPQIVAALKESPRSLEVNRPSPSGEERPSHQASKLSHQERMAAFGKQASKVKYFWRGTNFNYPYSFHKFYRINKPSKNKGTSKESSQGKTHTSEECSMDETNSCDHLLMIEDYSRKLINPADRFYK